MNTQIVPKIIISDNTEKILSKNTSKDFRINFSWYILFGDELRDDIINQFFVKDKKIHLRKAQPGDVFTYSLVPDPKQIKFALEQNLSNIAKLKTQRQLDALKHVWVCSLDIDEKEQDNPHAKPSVMVYCDPNSADVTKIVKEHRIVLAAAFIIEYNQNAEWVVLSPGDNRNIEEYNRYLQEMEEKQLRDMFFIDFSNKDSEFTIPLPPVKEKKRKKQESL
jgi:hypothetical protein